MTKKIDLKFYGLQVLERKTVINMKNSKKFTIVSNDAIVNYEHENPNIIIGKKYFRFKKNKTFFPYISRGHYRISKTE